MITIALIIVLLIVTFYYYSEHKKCMLQFDDLGVATKKVFQLYPINGWNIFGSGLVDGQTVNKDSYSIIQDVKETDGSLITEQDGTKLFLIARQTANGPKQYLFKGFRVLEGQKLMMIKSTEGEIPVKIFMTSSKDCQDLKSLDKVYPEITKDNNNALWGQQSAKNTTWSLTVLNNDFFQSELEAKFNSCLDSAMSSANIKSASGAVLGTGRFAFDSACQPVYDEMGNQIFVTTPDAGRGMGCSDAYKSCNSVGIPSELNKISETSSAFANGMENNSSVEVNSHIKGPVAKFNVDLFKGIKGS